MQQALTTPLFRSVVLGLVLLSLGATYSALRPEPVTRRLSLHAPTRSDAIYFSAWHNGDIRVTFDDDRLVPITFHTPASVSDGCRWLGIEQLTPVGDETFAYTYSEVILECDPDATPALKTPTVGYVHVD